MINSKAKNIQLISKKGISWEDYIKNLIINSVIKVLRSKKKIGRNNLSYKRRPSIKTTNQRREIITLIKIDYALVKLYFLQKGSPLNFLWLN